MPRLLLILLLLFPLRLLAESGGADEELNKLAWQNGPTDGPIAGKASIKVPEGYVFLDEKNTRRFIELNGNPPSDGNYMIAPKALNWFCIFSFNASGYVKDDETIDQDELLKSLMASDAPSNERRQRLGMRPIYTDGWQVPPHYDAETKRLEWGLRLRTNDGQTNVNYSVRLLGRTGVMSAILVASTHTLDLDIKAFKAALREFSYSPGETYAEFKQGDKVAEYGLAALILGGAAAVATKKGLWAVIASGAVAFWKAILGVLVAAGAAIGKFFGKKKE